MATKRKSARVMNKIIANILDNWDPETDRKIDLQTRGSAITNAKLGSRYSDEMKEKLRAANLGKKRGPVSEELREKLRSSNLGKQGKSVSIDGVVYFSTKEASRKTGLSVDIVKWRANSSMPKWKDWFFVSAGPQPVIDNKSAKEFLLTDPDGQEHRGRSLSDFCKKHGLHTICMRRVCRGELYSYKGWTGHYLD